MSVHDASSKAWERTQSHVGFDDIIFLIDPGRIRRNTVSSSGPDARAVLDVEEVPLFGRDQLVWGVSTSKQIGCDQSYLKI